MNQDCPTNLHFHVKVVNYKDMSEQDFISESDSPEEASIEILGILGNEFTGELAIDDDENLNSIEMPLMHKIIGGFD